MYFEAETLDDLLVKVFQLLLNDDDLVGASRGDFRELPGVLLQLQNPRARLSRSEMRGKVFSALGELMWYLSGKNDLDFTKYYLGNQYEDESDDGMTVRAGYGERLFNLRGSGINQIANVIGLLKRKRTTRQAVVQLFDGEDIAKRYCSVPCTCTLQFLLRQEKLHMFVSMRSNDAYLGLPHDVFTFTMLQEIIARSIGVDIGVYKHFVGSFHLYVKHEELARKFLTEGYQSVMPMPQMPQGDPWPAIVEFRKIEETLRSGGDVDFSVLRIDEYWADLCRMLGVFSYSKREETAIVQKLRGAMKSRVYHVYIDARLDGAAGN